MSTSAASAPSSADSVDPCADPTTPGARFLRKHGFLRIRLLAADVLRLEVLFRVDHLSQDLLNEIFSDPELCAFPPGKSSRVIRFLDTDSRVEELRAIVLRSFEAALGSSPGSLHFAAKTAYQLASRPKVTRMLVHRDHPLAFTDLRISFNINVSPVPRLLHLFPGSHRSPHGDVSVESLPVSVETGQWEVLAWNTSLFHAGPSNVSAMWQIALHGTVSNLVDPGSGSWGDDWRYMLLLSDADKVFNKTKQLVCRPLAVDELFILQL